MKINEKIQEFFRKTWHNIKGFYIAPLLVATAVPAVAVAAPSTVPGYRNGVEVAYNQKLDLGFNTNEEVVLKAGAIKETNLASFYALGKLEFDLSSNETSASLNGAVFFPYVGIEVEDVFNTDSSRKYILDAVPLNTLIQLTGEPNEKGSKSSLRIARSGKLGPLSLEGSLEGIRNPGELEENQRRYDAEFKGVGFSQTSVGIIYAGGKYTLSKNYEIWAGLIMPVGEKVDFHTHASMENGDPKLEVRVKYEIK